MKHLRRWSLRFGMIVSLSLCAAGALLWKWSYGPARQICFARENGRIFLCQVGSDADPSYRFPWMEFTVDSAWTHPPVCTCGQFDRSPPNSNCYFFNLEYSSSGRTDEYVDYHRTLADISVSKGFGGPSLVQWRWDGIFHAWYLGQESASNAATRYYQVSMPVWLPACAALLPVLLIGTVIVRRRDLERWRRKAGKCPSCGYDSRATPDCCPECGREHTRGSLTDALVAHNAEFREMLARSKASGSRPYKTLSGGSKEND